MRYNFDMNSNIKRTNVNIFNGWKAGAFLVNPVNTVGVMGKGLALQFKKEKPDHYTKYKSLCTDGHIKLGEVWVDEENKIIAFPTKGDWRAKSRIEDIVNGLKDLHIQAIKRNIKKIYIPKIGCGLGGLNYEHEVKPIILKEFNDSKVTVVIVEL